jgi:hypothetical protein
MTLPHSPLPWTVSQKSLGYPVILDAGGRAILKTDCSMSGGDFEQRPHVANANARLARAAGALYAALKKANLVIHPDDERGPCLCSQCEFSKAAADAIDLAESPL